MAAGEALPALYDRIWVTGAVQLQVHLTIWETAVEEIRSRPEDIDRGSMKALIHCNMGNIYALLHWVQGLPANNQFDDVGENSIQHQSQSHSWMTGRDRSESLKTRTCQHLTYFNIFKETH